MKKITFFRTKTSNTTGGYKCIIINFDDGTYYVGNYGGWNMFDIVPSKTIKNLEKTCKDWGFKEVTLKEVER